VADVAELVAAWSAERFGGPVTIADPVTRAGDGFDTDIYLVRFAGPELPDAWRAPLVLRVHPTAARLELANNEAASQEFCAARGFPAPRVLAVIPPGEAGDLPVQIMERAPGVTMLAAMGRRPWRIPALFDQLGALHASLHALPTEGWPRPDELDTTRPTLAERRLRLVRRTVETRPELLGDALPKALARVDALLPRLGSDRLTVCHGDVHPLNVLVDGNTATLIDWTDSCVGDPHGDVARVLGILRFTPIAAPNALARGALARGAPWAAARYRRAYTRAAGPIDDARLALWEPVHLTHDWTRASISAADPAQARRLDPRVIPWLEHRLDATLTALGA
jgi:aminoglycoside phosphotransferase (APT) family kinase protein